MEEVVRNKKVILRDNVKFGVAPKESDLIFTDESTIELKVQIQEGDGKKGQVLVKNLYLSCDPSMGIRMKKFEGTYASSYQPSQVPPLLKFCLKYNTNLF